VTFSALAIAVIFPIETFLIRKSSLTELWRSQKSWGRSAKKFDKPPNPGRYRFSASVAGKASALLYAASYVRSCKRRLAGRRLLHRLDC